MLLTKDTMFLDSLPLVYGSFRIEVEAKILNNGFTINYLESYLVVDSIYFGQSADIYYRVFQMGTNEVYFHKPLYMIEPVLNGTPRYLYSYADPNQGNSKILGDNINATGNISRGLGFGNTQDVVLNSSMNIQFNGKLDEKISIMAALSDNNNPLQPEGNTQQIQDFDKVFISIYSDSSYLTVGDFLMKTDPGPYFMKYYKKSRGFQADYKSGKGFGQHLHADAAVSRGRFVRNEIQGVEGNQGPYRLQGANGEFNIIIISGTEVVYLDGERLERGQQNDYVIDYNTGELTFMPKRLINKFNRIVVEFQYSDRNYARSVFTLSEEVKKGPFSAAIRYYSEQDNKQQPTDTSNASTIQEILANSGDASAFFNYEKSYGAYQFDRVNYRKIDSLGYTIFIYTNEPNSDTTFYTTVFSLVGANQGDYVLISSSANGRVYAWVEPVNGVPQGNYVPFVALVPPNRLQMLSASAAYQQKLWHVQTEVAYSNYNNNTYSLIDKGNDDGLGLFLFIQNKGAQWRNFKINTSLKSEYISSNFKFIERYRAVEFNRIWNRQLSNSILQTQSSPELINALRTEWQSPKSRVELELGNYLRSTIFQGWRANGLYKYAFNATEISYSQEWMSTQSKTTITRNNLINNSRLDMAYNMKSIRIGMQAVNEESRFSNDTSTSLEATSFRYQLLSGFIQSQKIKHWNFKIDATYRADDAIDGKDFSYASTGFNTSTAVEHIGKGMNRLNVVGSYRKLNVANSDVDENVALGRLEYNANFLKRVINSGTFYQIGTGREQKRTFSFSLVQSGNGNYTWVDYNNNGIEEINEFEPAIYADQAKYVKVWLPSNEFIKSNTNEFNQTIRLQAPFQWQSATPIKRFVSRFNSISTYKADRRITDNSLLTIINPFKLAIADSSLITVNALIKQTTFFNRSNAKFGLEHTIQNIRGKQFLSSGFEWKQNDKNQLITRLGLSPQFSLVLDLERSRKQNKNEFFENRNYDYTSQIVFPEFFFQTSKGFRAGTYFKYTEALNIEQYGGDKAFIQEYGIEMRYFVINRGNFDAKISSYDIKFTGNANTPLAFDVLNGLSNGRNLTWKLGFGGKTVGNIQINLSYEGRKTPISPAVHLGRAEARYLF
ncbi:MAG: hypothetical protein IT245_06585 [Bacteroidia bacterium]|nr:hypothetical protein [Bacteroidia bacterium]